MTTPTPHATTALITTTDDVYNLHAEIASILDRRLATITTRTRTDIADDLDAAGYTEAAAYLRSQP
ncbi:hypothetical protein [Saccharothrix violaceirubra]|uniref:Uncharacterized protein n=1 Tax=Saccharothrix violaceirubra TaxID=413306 RepID=A0A7W7SZJ3_9PSEU|nr:hypothetical protein [Saccharothrix violaceirubra]MBB4963803.1 hypothetical protein [Saccharothrix violaceirubra]